MTKKQTKNTLKCFKYTHTQPLIKEGGMFILFIYFVASMINTYIKYFYLFLLFNVKRYFSSLCCIYATKIFYYSYRISLNSIDDEFFFLSLSFFPFKANSIDSKLTHHWKGFCVSSPLKKSLQVCFPFIVLPCARLKFDFSFWKRFPTLRFFHSWV